MKLQILGTGCAKCDKLYKHAHQAVQELGIEVEVSKVTDLKEIMAFGVMVTPALAINGQVKTSGKVPSVEDIKTMIQ